MRRKVLRNVTWWIWAMSLWRLSQGIWLTLPASGYKCVSEEIQRNVVVLAHYCLVFEDPFNLNATLSVKVASPYGNILHKKENVTQGVFAYTTHEAGNYEACFSTQGRNQTIGELSVNLDWKTGIAAKDWDSIAKFEKIEGVELQLRKLEEAVRAIHENLIYLKNREREMRAISERTNNRVALCSMVSLTVCIAASTVQILYLKRYFTKKKLI